MQLQEKENAINIRVVALAARAVECAKRRECLEQTLQNWTRYN